MFASLWLTLLFVGLEVKLALDYNKKDLEVKNLPRVFFKLKNAFFQTVHFRFPKKYCWNP